MWSSVKMLPGMARDRGVKNTPVADVIARAAAARAALVKPSGEAPLWGIVNNRLGRSALAGIAAGTAGALLALGCRPEGVSAPRVVLAASCHTVAESAPLTVEVRPPDAGTLRIDVRERGVSVTVRLEHAARPPQTVASPIARSGWHVLVAPTDAHESWTVRVIAHDAAPAGGVVCLSASTYAAEAAATVAVRVARAEALAGSAVFARDWSAALRAYGDAARRLEEHGLVLDAAYARLAMASIDYQQLSRESDALALVGDTRTRIAAARLAGRDPALDANLITLEAESLMEGTDLTANQAPVRRLLAEARRAWRGSAGAPRELARLDTLDGFWSFLRQDRAAAAAAWQRSATACAALVDPGCEASALQNLGSIAQRNGDPELAARDFRQALAVLPPHDEPELAADIYDNLSQLRGVLGEFSAAEQLALAAMRLHAEAGDCDGGRRSLDGIGTLLAQVGDTEAARRYLGAALSGCSALLASLERGELPHPELTGDLHGESRQCSPSETVASSSESEEAVVRAILALAALDIASGEVAAARACVGAVPLQSGLATTRIRVATASATADLANGEAALALTRLGAAERDAIALRLPPDHLLRRRLDLASAHALLAAHQPRAAWIRASEALRTGASRSDPGQLLEAVRVAAQSLAQGGLESQAIALLRVGTEFAARIPVTALGPEAGATFVASQHAVFADATELLAREALRAHVEPSRREAAAWAALAMSEAGRARTARGALARTRQNAPGASNLDANLEPEAAGTLLALRQELSTRLRSGAAPLELSPTAAEQLTAALGGAVVASAPRDAQATAAATSSDVDLVAFATSLAPDTTAIEYAAAGEDLIAFVIHGGHLRTVALGPRADIVVRVNRWRALLQDPDSPSTLLATAAAELARRIWWPLHLERCASIVLVPEEMLSEVPFAALPGSPDAPDAPLVEYARTSVMPSLRYALNQASRSAGPGVGPFVILGDPVFRVAEWRRLCPQNPPPGTLTSDDGEATTAWTERLASLPGAAAEARAIATLTQQFRRAPTLSLLECAATARGLRRAAEQPLTLLHLATHARIDVERPRLSALALTPEWEGGELRSTLGYAEIVGLGLRARLVVLGACDTSRGRVLPGEGVLGPAQAFLQGGAASVVGTLWSVEDARTAEFMRRLYQYLLADHVPIAEALRRAQVDFRHAPESNGSQFWAAFAAYGQPDSTI
jgi:CHAT domain-containing protein/tetratricopeptide (TPR) repeat protein